MTQPSQPESADSELKQKFLSETAKVSWAELQRHFARGRVLVVDGDLDLIEVAVAMSNDDKNQVTAWLNADQLAHASVEQAKDWVERDPPLWTVVPAPWVLVQERREKPLAH